MFTFQNRETELALVQAAVGEGGVLNIHGEGGIGKSRLLKEAAKRIKDADPQSLVLLVDLQELDSGGENNFDQVVKQLSKQMETAGLLEKNERAKSSEIVARLVQESDKRPLFLFFDGTEVFQKDVKFWESIEQKIVSPILLEGRIHQVFAGRVPVPWRRFEVRRVVKLWRLEPLRPQPAIDAVQEILKSKAGAQNKNDEDVSAAVNLVLSFSFGHPLLSEKLAEYVAERPDEIHHAGFENQICQDVIRPFINDFFFKDVNEPWKQILWWISPLEWFDPTVLKLYLGRVAPEIIANQSDFFFIQGISELRIQHRVLWSEELGEHLQTVISQIINRCMQIVEPERYRVARAAAAATMEELAAAVSEDSQEHTMYEKYQQRYLKENQAPVQEG